MLQSIDVMDYSLLVGVDEEKHELVLGIIDFMRQYTWDKHLETWVKTSGILGGPKNASPTVISPQQYKKRFRKEQKKKKNSSESFVRKSEKKRKRKEGDIDFYLIINFHEGER